MTGPPASNTPNSDLSMALGLFQGHWLSGNGFKAQGGLRFKGSGFEVQEIEADCFRVLELEDEQTDRAPKPGHRTPAARFQACTQAMSTMF